MKLNLNNITLKISAGFKKQFPADRIPQVAFSGRSNVGKSSLINSLLGRKSLARVSAEPGKTITINFYDIDGRLYFVDLPGYGYAKRTKADQEKWSSLTDGFFTSNRNIDSVKLICQLIDSRTGPTRDDLAMIDYLQQTGMPYVTVATKYDKLNASEKKKFHDALQAEPLCADRPCICCSSKTGEGRDELWAMITESCGL
ncbi:MAG: YihA family ribosome biogenesis GTP-binding protein [Clostridia bacterium]|nr:YihA family ribosome biogenesis GTP-binding protein [Clostridia bacterium]